MGGQFKTVTTTLILMLATFLCLGREFRDDSDQTDDYSYEDFAENQEESVYAETKQSSKPTSAESPETDQGDDAANKGFHSESEEDLPEGFDNVDGVIMDISNVLVQEVKDNRTLYKPLLSKREREKKRNDSPDKARYNRTKEEAGWHFILFEDPEETPGYGHLVLLQKLFGFTIKNEKDPNDPESSSYSMHKKEQRLYQAFHIELGDEFDEMYEGSSEERDAKQHINNNTQGETPTDTMPSEAVRNRSALSLIPINPYDNAELVGTNDKVQEIIDKDKQEEDKPKDDLAYYRAKDMSTSESSIKFYQSAETVLGEDDSEKAKKILKRFENETAATANPYEEATTIGIEDITIKIVQVMKMMSEAKRYP